MQTKAEVKGRQGEIEIANLLREYGWETRYLDRLGKSPLGDWFMIEVKNKEPWEPPPAYRQGLLENQYRVYMELYQKHDLRCLLIVQGLDGWLVQFMHLLTPNDYTTLKDNKDYVFFNLTQFMALPKFLEKPFIKIPK